MTNTSDSRPVWSRTSDCQSGNPGSNPGCRIDVVDTEQLKLSQEPNNLEIILDHLIRETR
jgi:hypothetical protein